MSTENWRISQCGKSTPRVKSIVSRETVFLSQSALVFDDLDSFEGYWSGRLQEVPVLESVYCFSHN